MGIILHSVTFRNLPNYPAFISFFFKLTLLSEEVSSVETLSVIKKHLSDIMLKKRVKREEV